MLLTVPAGAIADIWDRRALMLLAQIGMVLASAVLTVMAFRGGLTPGSLLGFTFLLGCGSAVYGPAWQSAVGEQVPAEQLPAAIALNSLGYNLARTAGPAVGGLILATSGAPTAFLVNTLSSLGLIAALLRWRRPPPATHRAPERLWPALAAGLAHARASPPLRILLLRCGTFGLFSSALWATVPLIARDLLGGGPLTYGFLLGGFGAGAVIAALGSAELRRRWSSDAIATAATATFGSATLIASFSVWVPVTMSAMVLGGAAWVLSFSTFNLSVQLAAPRWVVGRMLAFYQTTAFGGMAVGSWAFGVLAHRAGLRHSLLTAGVLLMASVWVARRWPLHHHAGDRPVGA
jgi:MFS family permease